MKKSFHESDFQTLVSKWMKKNAWGSFPYELKVSAGKTVAFSAFEPQQLPSLEDAYYNIFHYKLTDASIGAKPFDAFVFKVSRAYVGIMFEKNKQQDVCFFIPISIIRILRESGAKSISKDFAEQHGIKINLKEV